MALETAVRFLERVEREESLRTQLYVTRPDGITELATFARGKGFVFSVDDLAEALNVYQERFPTGSVAPLRQYLEDYIPLPAPAEETDE